MGEPAELSTADRLNAVHAARLIVDAVRNDTKVGVDDYTLLIMAQYLVELDRQSCMCPGVMRTGCPCSRCHGSGWYPEAIEGAEYDYRECYCDCVAGKALREREAPTKGAP